MQARFIVAAAAGFAVAILVGYVVSRTSQARSEPTPPPAASETARDAGDGIMPPPTRVEVPAGTSNHPVDEPPVEADGRTRVPLDELADEELRKKVEKYVRDLRRYVPYELPGSEIPKTTPAISPPDAAAFVAEYERQIEAVSQADIHYEEHWMALAMERNAGTLVPIPEGQTYGGLLDAIKRGEVEGVTIDKAHVMYQSIGGHEYARIIQQGTDAELDHRRSQRDSAQQAKYFNGLRLIEKYFSFPDTADPTGKDD